MTALRKLSQNATKPIRGGIRIGFVFLYNQEEKGGIRSRLPQQALMVVTLAKRAFCHHGETRKRLACDPQG
ncbi:MAG: hypothetical protein J7K75_02100 [Desulfuromonas sp.]|nr:hypothetical protein [Desulfuromonas sp.]